MISYVYRGYYAMSLSKTYHIALSDTEAEMLEAIITDSNYSATIRQRCKIILDMDELHSGPALTHRECARVNSISTSTVATTLKLYREDGLDSVLTLKRSARSDNARRKVDDKAESKIIELANSQPPAGRPRWTLMLLKEHCDQILDVPVGKDAIARVLKQNGVKL